MRRVLLGVWVWLGWSASAQADPLAAPEGPRAAQVGIEVGAAPAMGLQARALGRVPRWPGLGTLHVGGAVGFPLATVVDGRTFDALAGARWRVPVWRRLSLAPRLSLGVASARNKRIDAVALHAPMALSVGWWADTWFVAGVLGYAPTLTTHVRHRKASKAAFEDRYPGGGEDGPRDGWYRTRSHVLRAGLEGGGVIRGRVTLLGGAGFQTPQCV